MTLPGVPALVTGSNTHVAWGFTNTYADWGDLDRARRPIRPIRIAIARRMAGATFEHFDETIDVAGEPAQHEP